MAKPTVVKRKAQAWVFYAGETRVIEVEIPGSMTPTGKPETARFTLHNEINIPLAYDIRVVSDPEPHIEVVIRKPTARENAQAEARVRTYDLVRNLRGDTAIAAGN